MIQFEGSGWRVARDPSRQNYPVLLGSDRCSVELSESEWNALVPLLIDLIGEYRELENHLVTEESLCVELERDQWWACLEGDQHDWTLQLIFQGAGLTTRGFEAFWPRPAAKGIIMAMRKMWDSTND